VAQRELYDINFLRERLACRASMRCDVAKQKPVVVTDVRVFSSLDNAFTKSSISELVFFSPERSSLMGAVRAFCAGERRSFATAERLRHSVG